MVLGFMFYLPFYLSCSLKFCLKFFASIYYFFFKLSVRSYASVFQCPLGEYFEVEGLNGLLPRAQAIENVGHAFNSPDHPPPTSENTLTFTVMCSQWVCTLPFKLLIIKSHMDLVHKLMLLTIFFFFNVLMKPVLYRLLFNTLNPTWH